MLENLRCSREGLTTEAAKERLEIFGYNKLEEKKVPIALPFVTHWGSFGCPSLIGLLTHVDACLASGFLFDMTCRRVNF